MVAFDALHWVFAAVLTAKLIALVVTTDAELSLFSLPVCMGVVLLGSSWLVLLKGPAKPLFLIALDVLISTLTTIDLVVLKLNDTLLNLAHVDRYLHFASQLPLTSFLLTLSRTQLALLWLDIPVLAIGCFAATWPAPRDRRRAFMTTMTGGLCLLVGGTIADPFWRSSSWQLPVAAAHAGFGSVHLFRVVDVVIEELRTARPSREEMSQLAVFAKAHQLRPTSDRPTPLNVLVVQVESLQGFVLGLKIDGQEVTPTLNALASHWTYFDHFYSQVGPGHTSDAEWLALCSQYPAKDDAAFFRYSGRRLTCLPALARREGARTLAFHGAEASVWNRAAMYRALRFDRFFSHELFPGAPTIGLGISDGWMLEKAVDMASQTEPFLAHVVTLSSHAPYDGVPQTLPLGEIAGTRLGKYLNAIHNADAALGSMLGRLEQRGLMGRTVIAIYGDHNGVSRYDPEVRALTQWSLADRPQWWEFDHRVPLLLHVPGIEPGVRHDPAGQIDLAPTLAEAAHYPQDDALFLGRSLLVRSAPNAVIFPEGGALTSALLFSPKLPRGHRCYDAGDFSGKGSAACDALASAAGSELSLGRMLVEKDLFGPIHARLRTEESPHVSSAQRH